VSIDREDAPDKHPTIAFRALHWQRRDTRQQAGRERLVVNERKTAASPHVHLGWPDTRFGAPRPGREIAAARSAD